MCDVPNLCSEVEIEAQVGNSDHYLLCTSIALSPVQETTAPRMVWIYSKADWDGLRAELASTNWDQKLNPDNPEQSCTDTTTAILQAMENHIPKKTLRSFTGKPEWYNEACEKAQLKKLKIGVSGKQIRLQNTGAGITRLEMVTPMYHARLCLTTKTGSKKR